MIDAANLQDRCDALTELYGLLPHRAVFDGRKATGGHIFLEPRHIVISSHMDDCGVDLVLRHELAHAKVFQEHGASAKEHGPEWQEAARLMGTVPVACSAPITPKLLMKRAAARARRTR